MSTAQVMTPEGQAQGALALPAEIFDVQVSIPLMHQVVVAQLAAARQGTHSTKTRGEVRGGGIKPWRQKGTGRARHGSIRSPQWVGGGVSHGPVPHGYDQRTPKKMKAAALRGALTDRARNDHVHVLTGLVDGDVPSTKAAAAALAALELGRNVLVVLSRDDDVARKSLRNLPTVRSIAYNQLNTYDVLRADDVVFTREALDSFLEFVGAAAAEEGAAAELTAKKAETKKAAPKKAEPKKAAAAAEAKAEPHKTEPASAADKAVEGEAPFGPGSHAPLDDDEQPEGFPIKGNASSKLYHVPGSSFYKRTIAEVWFDTPESAEAAGFLLPPSQRKAAEATTDEEDAK